MLNSGERLDQLLREEFEIIQNDDVFSFSTDALLLGDFTKVRNNIPSILKLPSFQNILSYIYSLTY